MEALLLKKLNLNDKEIKIYLNLLEYGAISVRGLADLSGINRGTVYDILKKLRDLNLASFYHAGTKQKFVAEPPEKLLALLKEKETELKNTKKQIKEIIPELNSLSGKGDNKPVTKYYEGKNGIKFILDDILKTVAGAKEKEYYVYSAEGVREDVYSAYPDYNKKRIKNNIKAITISLSEGGGTYGKDERRWLKNSGKKLDMTYILIYAGKCAFIARNNQNKPVGVIIENKMIYETQKNIFLQLWGLLK